jgi:hypothetical protein
MCPSRSGNMIDKKDTGDMRPLVSCQNDGKLVVVVNLIGGVRAFWLGGKGINFIMLNS